MEIKLVIDDEALEKLLDKIKVVKCFGASEKCERPVDALVRISSFPHRGRDGNSFFKGIADVFCPRLRSKDYNMEYRRCFERDLSELDKGYSSEEQYNKSMVCKYLNSS